MLELRSPAKETLTSIIVFTLVLNTLPVVSAEDGILVIPAGETLTLYDSTLLQAERQIIVEGRIEVMAVEGAAPVLHLVAPEGIRVSGTIILPTGAAAEDLSNQTVPRADNGDSGGSLILQTSLSGGHIELTSSATIVLGGGGDGGDAVNYRDNAASYGGNGGHGGLLMLSGDTIQVDGYVKLGRGGDGGVARSLAQSPGASSGAAVGGNGGDSSMIVALYHQVLGEAVIGALAWDVASFVNAGGTPPNRNVVTIAQQAATVSCASGSSVECLVENLMGGAQPDGAAPVGLPGTPGVIPQELALGLMPGTVGLPSAVAGADANCRGGDGAEAETVGAAGGTGSDGGAGADGPVVAGSGTPGGDGGKGGDAASAKGGAAGSSFDCDAGAGGSALSVGGAGGGGGTGGNGGSTELGNGGNGAKGGTGGDGGNGGDATGGHGGHSWFAKGGRGGDATVGGGAGSPGPQSGHGGDGLLRGGDGGAGAKGGNGGSAGTAKAGDGGCGIFDEAGPGGEAIIDVLEAAAAGVVGRAGRSKTSPLLDGLDGPPGLDGLVGVAGAELDGQDGAEGIAGMEHLILQPPKPSSGGGP